MEPAHLTSVGAYAALLAFVCAAPTDRTETTPRSKPLTYFEKTCDLLAHDIEDDDASYALQNYLGPWIVEFSWNIGEPPYVLITFRIANIGSIRRYKKNMRKYLITEPAWENASAIMVLNGSPEREVLMFKDRSHPGRFWGVPDFIRYDPFAIIPKKSVELFKIQTLFVGLSPPEFYLVVSGCKLGDTYFLRRDDLRDNFAPTLYHAALRVPQQIRYSSLHTGITYPEFLRPMRPEFLFEMQTREEPSTNRLGEITQA